MTTQLIAADFLARRQRAFLWDSPRVGKTGAAVIAADYIGARSALVVTTASGRGVWRRAFPAWQTIPRRVRVLGSDPEGSTDVWRCLLGHAVVDSPRHSPAPRSDHPR